MRAVGWVERSETQHLDIVGDIGGLGLLGSALLYPTDNMERYRGYLIAN
jgi:hypothetical protein